MVFAHQGGWDEMLFVALPIGLFAFLLYVANKKAQAQVDAERADRDVDSTPDPDDTST